VRDHQQLWCSPSVVHVLCLERGLAVNAPWCIVLVVSIIGIVFPNAELCVSASDTYQLSQAVSMLTPLPLHVPLHRIAAACCCVCCCLVCAAVMFVVFATAMLTVEDDAFWQGVEPVVFGGLPQLQVRFSLCLSPPPPPPSGCA
jgi:hypothetical protein